MKKTHSVSIIWIIILLFCSFADAKELEGPPKQSSKETAEPRTVVLTLAQCIERAIANSDELAAERHRLHAIEEQEKAYLWMPFSQFAITGTFSVVPDKCVDLSGGLVQACEGQSGIPSESDYKDMTWGPSFHIKFSGALPIPVSNEFGAARRALKEGYKAKEANLPTIQHQIKYNVQRAFHGVVGSREMLYTLSQGRKHLTKARERVETNLENQEGTETEIDLIKLKVFEAQLDAMEQQTIQIERSSLAALNFLTGIPKGRRVDVPEDPQVIADAQVQELDEYKRKALAHRPELEALRHAVKAFEAKVDLRRSEFIPDLAFVVQFRGGYTPGVEIESSDGTPFVFRNSYNYGSLFPGMALVMKYPLDFGVDIHKYKQAKAELSAMIIDRKRAIEGIMLEVEATYLEVTAISATIDALNKSKRLAKGWMAAAVQNHATGLGTSKEVKDALKEYFGIMAQLHQKIGEYNIGLAKLDKVTGVSTPQNE